jgi:hypothetical protein
MGHDSERVAMIYQHEARSADQLITNAIDAHVQGVQGTDQYSRVLSRHEPQLSHELRSVEDKPEA